LDFQPAETTNRGYWLFLLHYFDLSSTLPAVTRRRSQNLLI